MLIYQHPVRKAKFTDATAPDAFWKRLHALADAQYPALQEAIADILAHIAGTVDRENLTALLLQGQREKVGAVVEETTRHLTERLASTAPATLLRDLAMQAASETPIVQLSTTFNVQDPEAITFLNGAIREQWLMVEASTLGAVQEILNRAFNGTLGISDVIEGLTNSIGLTETQVKSLERYEAGLLQAGTSLAQIRTLVAKRTLALKKTRAEVIARTMTINAANAGQQARWEQAAREGRLDTQTARRHWVVTPDDRLCPFCSAIPGLNPEGVLLRQPFQTPGGLLLAPTAHPQCRCAVNLVFV